MTISSWREQLREAVGDPHRLLQQAGLDPDRVDLAGGAVTDFPVRVPEAWLGRVRPGRLDDPLLRQVLPLAEEDRRAPGYSRDPLDEVARQPVPGLLSKYRGRALLVATPACAIHCRYCFRRHFPYQESNAGRESWRPALDALRRDRDIHEIILSGGDPLSLSDDKLDGLLQGLDRIDHLRRLRVHSRIPVVLPDRVTARLVSLLTDRRLQPVMVIHANHPDELDAAAGRALARLHRAGLTLLNQSVLLRGVNDDVTVLAALSERLFQHRVLPYYLHMLDPVAGAAHFEVAEPRGREIIEALRARLPGYLVPRLVREEPGAPAKTPL